MYLDKVQPKYSHFGMKNYRDYVNNPLYTKKLFVLAAVNQAESWVLALYTEYPHKKIKTKGIAL